MKKLLLMMPFFVMTACEVIVDIDVPSDDPQLALAALAPSDSTWRVEVTKSRNSLAYAIGFDSVTNAVVTITDETAGTSVVLEHQYYSRYRNSEMPIPGHEYSIKVEAEGFKTVTGSTIAPDQVSILSASIDTTTIVYYKHDHGGQETTYPMSITFSDPGGVKNTYELEIYTYDSVNRKFEEDDPDDWRVYKSFAITYMNDPALVEKKDYFNTDANPHRFSDHSFDGQQKTVTVLLPEYFVRFANSFRYGVRLYNQGDEFAKFVDDRNLQFDIEGFPFAQPAPVYSNLSNRNGIFAIKTGYTYEWDAY